MIIINSSSSSSSSTAHLLVRLQGLPRYIQAIAIDKSYNDVENSTALSERHAITSSITQQANS